MSSPTQTSEISRGRKGSILYLIVVIALLLAGIGAVAASLIPFSVLFAKVRGMSSSGQATFFTADFYHAMRMRLLAIAVVNLAFSTFIVVCRKSVIQVFARVLDDAHSMIADSIRGVKAVPFVDRVILILLTTLAAFFRAPLLTQTMRYDEAYTFLQYSSHPFYAALSFYNFPNNHLLNTLLVRVSYLCFGNNTWALRLPVFIAGLCLVPATYFAYKSLYRDGGALLAAGLVASSSVLIEFSTNARGYIMVCLIFIILIPIVVYVLRTQNRTAWSLVGIGAALGFYAVPIMLYPFGGLVLWILIAALLSDSSSLKRILPAIAVTIFLTAVLTFELYSPVVAVSGPRSLIANKWVAPNPLNVFLHDLPKSLVLTWNEWNRSIPFPVVLLIAVMFLISLIWHRRCSKEPMPFPLALAIWIIPVLCLQRVVPFERVWLFALPVYFIGASAGFAVVVNSLLDRTYSSAANYVLAAFSLVATLYLGFALDTPRAAYLANDCRGLDGVVRLLKSELQPGDSVAVDLPSDMPLVYYFQKSGISPSFINAQTLGRQFVVVNDAAGDTIRKVAETTKIAGDVEHATSIAKVDSVALYQLPRGL